MPDRRARRTASRRGFALCFRAGLALVVAVLPPHAGQAQAGPRFEEARALIRAVMAERILPSVAVAVAEDGEVVWEEAFGWADREERIPATPHTLYSVASLTKPFTATGLRRLVEDGREDLDEPVNAYPGPGRIPTPDAERRRYIVVLEVRLHGDTLRGPATARSPGHFALSSYLEVARWR